MKPLPPWHSTASTSNTYESVEDRKRRYVLLEIISESFEHYNSAPGPCVIGLVMGWGSSLRSQVL